MVLWLSYCGSSIRRTTLAFPSTRTIGSSRRRSSPYSSSSLRDIIAPSSHHHGDDENFFLHQVERTVDNVLQQFGDGNDKDNDNGENPHILQVPPKDREAVGVARNLNQRLQALRRNNDCPRCWMQRAHCICQTCPPVDLVEKNGTGNDNENDDSLHRNTNRTTTTTITTTINRIFLIMHHKEIAMKVDTAKLILAAFPTKCRLVVGGIGPEHQDSMKELLQAMQEQPKHCLVLFPDESAQTYSEIVQQQQQQQQEEDNTATTTTTTTIPEHGWDLIVLDGTWVQARKLQTRYIPEVVVDTNNNNHKGPRRVKLSDQAVAMLDNNNNSNNNNNGEEQQGHQLRRHCTMWRQVGTFEATRLFLRDVLVLGDDDDSSLSSSSSSSSSEPPPVWEQIASYQEIANQAARRELGPPRVGSNEQSSV
jgi:DTW domain-containing protein YfiP